MNFDSQSSLRRCISYRYVTLSRYNDRFPGDIGGLRKLCVNRYQEESGGFLCQACIEIYPVRLDNHIPTKTRGGPFCGYRMLVLLTHTSKRWFCGYLLETVVCR